MDDFFIAIAFVSQHDDRNVNVRHGHKIIQKERKTQLTTTTKTTMRKVLDSNNEDT